MKQSHPCQSRCGLAYRQCVVKPNSLSHRHRFGADGTPSAPPRRARRSHRGARADGASTRKPTSAARLGEACAHGYGVFGYKTHASRCCTAARTATCAATPTWGAARLQSEANSVKSELMRIQRRMERLFQELQILASIRLSPILNRGNTTTQTNKSQP